MENLKREVSDFLAEREYIGIYLRTQNEQRVYKREGYDILTYFGDLGGVFDLLFLTCSLFSGLVTARFFQASLISAAYRIQETAASFSTNARLPAFLEYKSGSIKPTSNNTSSGMADDSKSLSSLADERFESQPAELLTSHIHF